MKKYIVMLLLLASFCTAQTIYSRPTGDWWSGSLSKDVAWRWAKTTDGLVNAGMQLGTGSIFYVSSNVDTEGNGTSWETAKDTIDEAIGLCTADAGDVIYVDIAHKEVEATAATSLFTLDVAGVSIIGINRGGYEATVASGVITLNQRPTLVIDAADATITVSAKHCRVSGFLIVSDIDNVAVAVTVAAGADGFTIDNCVFRDNAANLDMLVMLSIAAAAQNVNIIDNRFVTTISAGGNNAILLVGANTNIVIAGNYAYGKFATGCLLGAAAQVNADIRGNTFVNAEGDIAIALHTSSTGILTYNNLGGTTTLASTLTGDDAMWCYNNLVSGAVAVSGAVNPTADAD